MSEEALLLATRDRIREVCGYSPEECEVDYDEYAPPTTGEVYVCVSSGDWSAGPLQGSGNVLDQIFSVRVTVLQRAASKPADRFRNLYYTNINNINRRCREIVSAVDFRYEVTTLAAQYAKDADLQWHHPLQFQGTSGPATVGADYFKAATYMGNTTHAAGLKRVISFGNCRVTSVRSY